VVLKNLPVHVQPAAIKTGSVSPGLPASPQPGLKGAGVIDGVFFSEEHV
jgi:hypothetical protein